MHGVRRRNAPVCRDCSRGAQDLPAYPEEHRRGHLFEGLSLPVSDLDRSIRFYEALGFATEVRTHQFGLMRYGTGTLGLQLGARAMRDPRGGAAVRRSFVQIEMGIARLAPLGDGTPGPPTIVLRDRFGPSWTSRRI